MIRSLRREVAKNTMKKHGMIRICAHHGNRGHGSKRKCNSDSHSRSYFATHWGEFV